MLTLPNPYIVCAAVALSLAALTGVYLMGRSHERTAWEASSAKAQIKANELARAQEAKYQALKDEVEKGYAQTRNNIDDAYQRGLKSGRLRDKGGVCKPVSSDPAPAGSPPATATGCELSEEATRFLRNLARDADLAAAYARAGHDYAVGLPQAK